MPRHWLRCVCLLGVTALCLSAISSANAADDREALKQRFKQRYPALVKLKQAGTIGETTSALVAVVKDEDLDKKIDEKKTVRSLLDEENGDRLRLYDLLARDLQTTAEKIARRDAVRRFSKAEPDEYLRLRDGTWVQKKEIGDELMIELNERPRDTADRAFWEKKASSGAVRAVEELGKLIQGFAPSSELSYNKAYIGPTIHDRPNNFVVFRPEGDHVVMELRLDQLERVDTQLKDAGIKQLAYNSRWGRYRLSLSEKEVADNATLLAQLMRSSLASGI